MSAQLATKEDLDLAILASEARLGQRITETEARIDETEARLGHRIDETEARLMQRIAEASEHTARVMMDRMDRMGDQIADRIGRDLERHIRASDERNLDSLRAVDDQYRRLPVDIGTLRAQFDARADEVARLSRELDAHVRDDSRHLTPRAAGRPAPSGGPPDKEA